MIGEKMKTVLVQPTPPPAPKFIRFADNGLSKTGKTKRWIVWSKEGDTEQMLDAPTSRAFEHSKRIRLVEEGKSYAEVAKQCNVSSRSTIAQDVKVHNESVRSMMYCELCKRGKCELSESLIKTS